jgi:hypothetical protein
VFCLHFGNSHLKQLVHDFHVQLWFNLVTCFLGHRLFTCL